MMKRRAPAEYTLMEKISNSVNMKAKKRRRRNSGKEETLISEDGRKKEPCLVNIWKRYALMLSLDNKKRKLGVFKFNLYISLVEGMFSLNV